MDVALTGTTTPGQSWPGRNHNQGLPYRTLDLESYHQYIPNSTHGEANNLRV